MNLYYGSVWVNIFEFFVGIPLVFLLVPFQGIEMSDLMTSIGDGWLCLVLVLIAKTLRKTNLNNRFYLHLDTIRDKTQDQMTIAKAPFGGI